MRYLYLLRHAKSSWDDPSLDDHDRPLAPRGRRGGKKVASYLHREGIRPELILCSSAERARETLQILRPTLADEVPTLIERGIYGADDEELLVRLQRVPDEVRSVMLIGHNPGIQDLANILVASGRGLVRMRSKYPTGAIATLGFRGRSWSDLRSGGAELLDFVVPKEIA